MRKHYIDNLRWMAVLMLFPYHVFMIYNSFGEGFYIKGADIALTSGFIVVTGRWFMPLLFAVAGASSAFALRKRNAVEYVKERVMKLMVPFVFGILLLIPPQTYFAERFHNGYSGGYFEQYALFFKVKDLLGYDGGFTPGHLWFILYLFIISLFSLPIMRAYLKSKKRLPLQSVPFFTWLLLFIVPLLGFPILNIGGKSFGEYFVYFMFGYFLLSDESILEKAEQHRFPLLLTSIVASIILLLWWRGAIKHVPSIAVDAYSHFYAWTTILALLGLARRYLNFQNKLTDYFSKSSFAVYVFHQTWIVAAAYYTFTVTNNAVVQMLAILCTSVAATFASYELCKRIAITRFLFGIRKCSKVRPK